ncbi:MAG: type 2 isopentenyl-diphosphate Delta-isomerase [Chlorobiales bacterium]|nr:type 2 isopentenyl-diphosphate Delta-isomerase [Chlorobiales bacterium]
MTVTETVQRKQSHVEVCLNDPIEFDKKTGGFERYAFEHNAAPEVNFNEIDLSTTFLGRPVSYPLMISSMTGGYSGATFVNQVLARVCERLNIPLGVGSMRQALENEAHQESFAIVREVAPSIQIFANIGAPEIATGLSKEQLHLLLDLFKANGLIVHLNPAQELFQPEGNTNFKNFLSELKKVTQSVGVPVIAKEVGTGISASVAEQLIEAGVSCIDVAGAGGTSWQKVEEVRYLRKFAVDTRFSPSAINELLNWGIPTAECLAQIKALKAARPNKFDHVEVISSGGISNGLEIAKSLALGAQIAASARPLLKALLGDADEETGEQNIERVIMTWMNDLRAVMFLVGAGSISELRKVRLQMREA